MTKILDACCGGKMMWFNKNEPHTTFMDIRQEEMTMCDGRHFEVKPDVIGDFRKMPFADGEFDLVLFDPPHLMRVGQNSWLQQHYGTLDKDTWRADLRTGFSECFRVLKRGGVLIFKWSEYDIKVSEVLKLTEHKPLFGNKCGKTSKTHWLVFLKEENA